MAVYELLLHIRKSKCVFRLTPDMILLLIDYDRVAREFKMNCNESTTKMRMKFFSTHRQNVFIYATQRSNRKKRSEHAAFQRIETELIDEACDAENYQFSFINCVRCWQPFSYILFYFLSFILFLFLSMRTENTNKFISSRLSIRSFCSCILLLILIVPFSLCGGCRSKNKTNKKIVSKYWCDLWTQF